MARFTTGRAAWPAALGAAAMLMLSAPASADPVDPVPSPPPTPDVSAPVQVVSTDQPAPAPPTPDTSAPVQAVSTDHSPPADQSVPHLSSPENLPPGTTEIPDEQGPRMSYLRELWHAYQTQEVSGGDALLLLTQRPMNATSAPPPGMAVGPQAAPIAPAAPAAEAPPDAPAVLAPPGPAPGPPPELPPLLPTTP